MKENLALADSLDQVKTASMAIPTIKTMKVFKNTPFNETRKTQRLVVISYEQNNEIL
jgi:hypothetical protein